MIHEIFVSLRSALRANGVPFEVIYGPSQVPPKVGATRVQMLRDYEAGDALGPPRGPQVNPRHYAVRSCGALVRIFASSTLEGAQRHDHERIADRLADQVIVALHKIVRDARTLWRVQRVGFVPDSQTDNWAGVVYEIKFQIDRGVADLTWKGEAAAEATGVIGSTSLDVDGPGVSTGLPNATTRIKQ